MQYLVQALSIYIYNFFQSFFSLFGPFRLQAYLEPPCLDRDEVLFRQENFASLIVSVLLSAPKKSHHSNYHSYQFVRFPCVMFLGPTFGVVSCQVRSIPLPLCKMSRTNYCSFYFYSLVLHLNVLNTYNRNKIYVSHISKYLCI